MAPPIEEPPPARKTEVQAPLPLPLPNIPVGGRLDHFAQDWAKITDDKWVLSVIRDGYRIPFLERPILSPDPVFFQQPLSQHLEEEVASLISKGAVEEIILECPGHYSRIFLVPKKNGKLRLIIDLSVLNHFVYTQTFKMETQRKVKDAVQLNNWAFSLDLTDAYLHIPIHYRSRKFLRFTLRGRVPVQGTPIRPLDKSFRVYTPYGGHHNFPKEKGDNSTSLSRRLARTKPKSSKTVGTQTIHFVTDQLTRSDYQLRKIRPSSSPSVHFHRDGVSDPYQYRQSTSEQANEDIGDSQNVFTENLCISQRFPVSLGTTECCSRSCNAGTVTSPAITSISAQSVETSESSVFSSDSYDIENSVSSQMVASGRSLSSGDSLEDRSSLPHHLYRCQPVRLGSPCGTGGTSVSWTMDGRPIPATHQCVRDESNFSLSITSSSQGKEHHCTTTVVAYIRHQGGTHSTELSEEVWSVLNLCFNHNIQLLVKHIPGRFNTLADRMSQVDKPISTEWSLNQEIANKVFQIMDFPSIKLFATPLNHRLPFYVSPIPDQKALSIDALSMDWNRIHAYAFPPFHLNPAVINKIRLSQCKIVLIAPLWPDRPWFPELLIGLSHYNV